MKEGFKDRLINEYNEVYARREKLHKFLNEVDEDNRPCDNSRSLLVAQLFAMDTYIQVLRLRFLELHIQWDDFHVEPDVSWIKDYSTGFDTAKDDIKEKCINQKTAYSTKSRSEWNSGYISALVDVIEYIERM